MAAAGRGTGAHARARAARLSRLRAVEAVPAAALVVVLGWLVLLPIYRLQAAAFTHGAEAYRNAIRLPQLGDVLTTTVWLAVGSTVLAVVFGTVLAYLATRLPRRWSWLSTLPILPLVIPAAANVVGWIFLLSPGPGYINAVLRRLPGMHAVRGPVDVYTLPWIVIIVGFSLAAFVYLFVRSGLRNINPDLQEAARVCGASEFRTFVQITLPLLRPALVYATGVAMLLALGQFTAPLLLGSNRGVRVLTTAMYQQIARTPTDYGTAAALGTPLVLVGLCFVVLQKMALGHPARFVSQSGKAHRSGARESRSAAWVLGIYGFVAVVLPVIGLVIVALSPFWSGQIVPSRFTVQNLHDLLASPAAIAAIRNSVVASIGGVAIALPLGYAVANFLRARAGSGVLRWLTDFLVNLPLSVPAVVFGAGFLYAYSRPPLILYGTNWVIVLVYVTLMLPFTTRMQLAGLMTLGPVYSEASHVSGAGALRTHLSIMIPLMRSTLSGAAVVMFILLTHEFSASLLVRSVNTQVMGTLLYDYWTNGSYPQVASLALVMCAVTTGGVLVALRLGGRSGIEGL
jgi:iron(III) transport system permease protein